jgi:hypothetical protein
MIGRGRSATIVRRIGTLYALASQRGTPHYAEARGPMR